MAYIGAEPLPGQNREVDDISSSFNGSTTAFTLQVNGLNVSPETANNILVNIGGVIQNPGTDYTIAASTITFTTAPASGLSFFALILGAGINTATVADDTIGPSKLINTAVTAGSYTTADITVDAQGRITAAASGTISGAEIADQAVTNAKVNNSAAIARSKLANVDLVDDTSPQLGGDLDTNSFEILLDDLHAVKFGDSNDLSIFHQSGFNQIQSNNTSPIQIRDANNVMLRADPGGAVDLRHNGSVKFATTSIGNQVTGQLVIPDGGNSSGNNNVTFGNDNDCHVYHNGTDFFIVNNTGNLDFRAKAGEKSILAAPDGAVELYHNNSKKLFTTSSGITAGNPDTSQTSVVGTQVGFFAGAKSLFAGATGLIQNQVCILDTTTSAAAGTGGALSFGGYITSSSTTFYATIEGIKENGTSNNYAGRLRFRTRTHNQANMVEGMNIDSSGDVFMGKDSSNLDITGTQITASGQVLRMVKSGTGAGPIILNRSTNVGTFIEFRRGSSNLVGTISSNNTTTSYNTSSDYRLKENVTTISDGITRLKTLKPSRFNFKTEKDTIVDGFLAHEVTAVPEAITGTKDETQDILYTEEDTIPSGKEVGDVKETIPVYQGIDQSKLVPLLTAALQEAITKIETLETKVAALEAA